MKKDRKLLTPTFHFKVLRHYMAETVEITDKLIDKLVDRCAATASGAVVDDIQEILSSHTLEVLLRNIFSIDIDEHEWGREFTDATT